MKSFKQFLCESIVDVNTMSKGEIFDLIDRYLEYIESVGEPYAKFFAAFPEKQWEDDKELGLRLSKSTNPNLTPKEKRRIKDIVEEDALEPGFDEANNLYDPEDPDDMSSDETKEYHRKKGWIDELWRRLYKDIEVAEHILKRDPSHITRIKKDFPELAKKHTHLDMGDKFGVFKDED